MPRPSSPRRAQSRWPESQISARRLVLPVAFGIYRGAGYEKEISSSGDGRARRVLAPWSHHRRVRAAHQRVPDRLRHPRHPADRAHPVPVRQDVGVHGGGAVLRHPAVHSHKCIRHRGRDRARRADRLSDGGVSGEGRPAAHPRRHVRSREPACRHPVGGLRSRRHARARAGHPQGVSSGRRREPVRRHRRAGDHDPAVDHQGVRHGARGRAARV